MTTPIDHQNPSNPSRQDYTPQGQHPEDRIYADKQYINRLQEHMSQVFQKLIKDLQISKEGEELLFDFVFNEEEPMEFSDMLTNTGIAYSSLKKEKLGKEKTLD